MLFGDPILRRLEAIPNGSDRRQQVVKQLMGSDRSARFYPPVAIWMGIYGGHMSDVMVGQIFGVVAIGTILSALIAVAIHGIVNFYRFLRARRRSQVVALQGQVGAPIVGGDAFGAAAAVEQPAADETTPHLQRRATDGEPATAETSRHERPTLETYTVYERFFRDSKRTLKAATAALGNQEIAVASDEETSTIPAGIDPRLIPTLQPAFDRWNGGSNRRSAMGAV